MKAWNRFFTPLLFLILVTATAITGSSSITLGISPQDVSYFKSEVIKCRDGSNKFTQSQLNDDFCDCPDGTDEPGTSACPGGKFYCTNAGHAPLLLFSSRVNDGICDCCDGSDEYDGKANCSNTCWEAGKVARDKLKKKIATYEQGVTVRHNQVQEAKKAIAKDQEELSKLKSEEKILKKLVEQLKERKDQIEKAEEKERLEKEKEEKKKRESEEKVDDRTEDPTEKHKESDDTIGDLDSPSVEQHAVEDDTSMDEAESIPDAHTEVSTDEALNEHVLEKEDSGAVEVEVVPDSESKGSSDEAVKQEKDESDKTEQLSKEELGRLVASRWTGENTEEKTDVIDDTNSEEYETSHSSSTLEGEDSDGGYASEEDQKYDDHKYDEDEVEDEYVEDNHDDSTSSYTPENYDPLDDYSDVSETSNPSWLEKIQKTVRNILNSVNLFQTPVNISDSAHVKKEYEESNSKLSKIESRISSLSEKLKQDFGQDKEFYSFYGRCFENKENKYVYKVCPFKQASQVEGHSTTRLGEWDKFDDSHKAMVFSNGDKCWNGPDRSLKVKLRCGLKNELTDVDEPSRCEYVALLATPALCVEERLKDLRDKLDRMNTEQPQNHDEL